MFLATIKELFKDTLERLQQSTFTDWCKAYIKTGSIALITGSIIYLAQSVYTALQANMLSILKANCITLLIINLLIILISCVTIPSLAFTHAAFFRYAPKISLFYLIIITGIFGSIKIAFFIQSLFVLQSTQTLLVAICVAILLSLFHYFVIKFLVKEKTLLPNS